jgi:site-specific DNA-methyltransferase (adenine-specific)
MLEINKIHQGDCLEVMKDIPDKSVDMILCDLPYGTTACKWDTIIPFEPLWKQYRRIIKDNGAIVLTASQPFTSALVMSNIKMFKYEWIWNKNRGQSFILAKKQPLRSHENILVFYKNMPIYNYQLRDGNLLKGGYPKGESNKSNILGIEKKKVIRTIPMDKRYPITSLYFDVGKASKSLHPTQKPVALFEYLIKTYTNEGDLVLDNCIGSGTTAVACINTNRNFIGIELSPEYCEIANKRIDELSSKEKSK